MNNTSPDRRAALAIILAIAETIREARTTPAGIVYAALMTRGCTLQQFEHIIAQLVGAGLVKQSNSMLTWVGPMIKETR